MKQILRHPSLGDITVHTHPRATRYTVKVANGKVSATMPSSGSFRKLYDFINENESRLEAALLEYPKRNYIDESFRFKTLTFDVSVTRSDVSNFYLTLSNGQLRIACPSDTDFHSDEVQERLKKMIGSALRHEAKRILPKRLDELAGKHGFSYAEVKINGSRTHWGSCTSRKNINLSYSLLLLPPHLIDYVLLHELCHTLEMSHNQRFWELLDNTCGNRAKSLRQELQNYRML